MRVVWEGRTAITQLDKMVPVSRAVTIALFPNEVFF